MNFKILASLLAVATPAAAATLVLETGFEPPDFSLGDLNGQSGWSDLDVEFTVQDVVVKSGTQAVRWDASDFTLSVASHGLSYDTSLTRVQLSMDFYATGVMSAQAGVLLGNADRILGVVNTVGPIGTAMVMSDGSGTESTVKAFSHDTWHALTLDLDFASQTITGSLDGSSFGTLSFSGPATGATYVHLFGNEILGSVGTGGSAYIDNLRITAVPEPEAAAVGTAVVLLGAGVLIRRGRAVRTGPANA